MITNQGILDAIQAHASGLKIPPGSKLDGRVVLATITYPETRWGQKYLASMCEDAYRPAWGPRTAGRFYKSSQAVRDLHAKYGDAAASSWSAWQILYVTATEVGFTGHPWDLTDHGKACAAVVNLLNARCFNYWSKAPTPELAKPADTIDEVGDFWNSGSFRDSIPPIYQYLPEIRTAYAEACAHYGVPT